MSDLGLAGRSVLVVGATKGLGLAIARKFRASGAHVLLDYAHDDEAAKAALASLEGLPGSASLIRADPSTEDGAAQLAAAVSAAGRGLDVLVHNAASWHPMPAAGASVADLHTDVATALDPLLRLVPALLEHLAPGGRVLAVSSSGAQRVIPRYVALGVAKAALESLVRYLAVELAPRGITVNAVTTAKLDKGDETTQPEMVQVLAARTPAGRLSTPADVADVVALLSAPEASWIHGQVITADGGLSLRS
ncbi:MULTISPECIES: SDR family oxidoreductase [unclassified Amycolatopsis]|uniref:SDR family oxidoreductase n=1 Tax=unclassified Amycolatopsis TaxID=2618356 RepID=UPI00106DDA79|nr:MULTISPECIES: SDR family oxidoreductase [unclassified Amycolatopsis]